MNWDVAIAAKEKQMGVGVLIRDEQGNVITGLSKPVMALYDPASAEALAALCAVEFCLEVGIQKFILEGDSLLVVKAFQDPNSKWLRYGQMIEDALLVLGSFRNWKIQHIKRKTNEVAHGLAKNVTRISSDIVWLEEPPSCIFDIIILEQLALSL